MSVINALYKTICQVSLSYSLNKLCLLGDLNNEYAEASLLLLMNLVLKPILPLKLLHGLEALSPREPEQ